MRRIRVLIVDDEPLFIESVEALLAGDDRVEVVGTARNGKGGSSAPFRSRRT